ncbi:MAG: glycoside hydrolase family 127 protein [Isosphaeraceae bacterium]
MTIAEGDHAMPATLRPRPGVSLFTLALLAGSLTSAALGAEEPKRTPLKPALSLRMSVSGPMGSYLSAVTQNWLLPAPAGNPAILAMFADRDRTPHRDLLPWSGEFAGKYLTGATQVLRTTGDERLRQHLDHFAQSLPPLQDRDGYLGPFPREHRLTGSAPNIGGKPGGTWDAWGHYHMMLGLLLWNETSGDTASLDAARRIGDLFCDRFLGDRKPRLVDTGSTEMNLAPAHGLCLLYEKTREKRYLDLARQIVEEFAAADARGQPLAGDYFRRGLAGEEFYRLPKPRWESLHPVLALAELARITRDPQYARAFANLWWSIAKLDRHNNGGFSSGEQAQGNPYHRGAIETCCTIAWMAMTVEMLRLTGDPVAADELELSTFNSALGLFSPSGRWSTYNTPMDGDRKANFHEIVFQARPGSPELNCCSVNAARGLGLLSDWALMADEKGDGLVLNWYGPGAFTTKLPSGVAVRLSNRTSYPVDGEVRIRVEPERHAEFPLRLRIPHWSARTKVRVNDEPVSAASPATYLELRRTWRPGDEVVLKIDMTPHVWAGEKESAGRVSIFRGPILLAFDQRFNPGMAEDPPAIDLAGAMVLTNPQPSGPHPILLVEARTAAGPVLLCDFASEGRRIPLSLVAEGRGRPVEFSREHPGGAIPFLQKE